MIKHLQKIGTNRLSGFSDGVFAICVTLLVLNLQIPVAPDGNLITVLRLTEPKLEVWAISYLIIGLLWIMHHNIFAYLKYTNNTLLWLNLLFLMIISLLPWTTDLVGTYTQQPLALILFSGSLGLAGLLLLIAWIYAVYYGKLCLPDLDERTIKVTAILAARIPVVAIISITLAGFHRSLAIWSWVLVTLFGVIIRRSVKIAGSENING